MTITEINDVVAQMTTEQMAERLREIASKLALILAAKDAALRECIEALALFATDESDNGWAAIGAIQAARAALGGSHE